MLRSFVVLSVVVVGACSHGGGMKKQVAACSAKAGADPGACLAVANDRMMAKDEDGAKQYVEAATDAIGPGCLHDHAADGCFKTIVLLLGDEPVGLLAGFDVSQDLRVLAPKSDGTEATDPRVRARTALLGMCGNPASDPIERQRACIVLGDLVTEEQVKRCGEGCDVATAKLGGWGKSEILDAYGEACKVASAPADKVRAKALADVVRKLYAVTGGGEPACSLATSPLRGASVADAVDNIRRIQADAHARERGAKTSEQREATRIAQMKQNAVAEQAKAQREADAKAAQELKVALDSANWAVAYELIRKRTAQSPVDEPSATALVHVWDSFVAWAISQGTPMAVYLDVNEAFLKLPVTHALPPLMASLRDRALSDVKGRSKNTRGRGGAWLYAALASRVGGPSSPEARAAAEQYEKLVAEHRISVAFDKLSPACTPLVKEMPGKKVRATAALVCTVIPEKKWTAQEPMTIKQHVVKPDGSEEDVEQIVQVEATHRAFSVAVHGSVTVQGKTIPVEFEETLDDKDGTSTRTFEQARAAAIDTITKAVVAPLETAAAEKELTAAQSALKVQRQGAAEDHLVSHALLVGSSAELDELLTPFGVTFTELVQASR
ncbi:MAG TPA: hypothetical protein VL326_28010 [Kofleriaceae bacterium]|nr:hypothetical protein [Kofleriaceae bacterium]